jgi:hypothetical protein
LVAAQIRTSTLTGAEWPMGVTSCSCSTRRKATCEAGGSSATSSRKSVPRSALRMKPGRSSCAPEKAPRRWPNSSDSSSESTSAPQFMATNGPLRPESWLHRARRDLLAGAARAEHHQRHRRRRQPLQGGEVARQRVDEGPQGRHRGRERRGREVGRPGQRRHRVAVEEEGVADLDDVAIGEHRLLDLRPFTATPFFEPASSRTQVPRAYRRRACSLETRPSARPRRRRRPSRVALGSAPEPRPRST